MQKFYLSLVLGGFILLAGGCAPSLRPLYYDYEPFPSASDSSFTRVQHALREAGWHLAPSDLPNTVATQEQTVQKWGIYTIDVSLEAVPMSDGKYVRLFVHPYRNFIIGGKSKLAYLPSGLRHDLFPSLNDAFQKRDLHPIGTPFTHDELEQ